MKVLILISFVALFGFNCFASIDSKQNCLDKTELSLDFSFKGSFDSKITKNGSKLKFVVFHGRGEKYEVDLSRGDISIDSYPSMESKKALTVRAGSANCSKPLFGADFDLNEGDAVRFASLREKILTMLDHAESVYALDKVLQAKLACTAELVKDYLNDCLSIAPAKN